MLPPHFSPAALHPPASKTLRAPRGRAAPHGTAPGSAPSAWARLAVWAGLGPASLCSLPAANTGARGPRRPDAPGSPCATPPRPHCSGARGGRSPGALLSFLGLGQGQDENGRADGPRWAGRPPPGASGPSPGREDGQACAWSSRHGPNLLWGSSGAGLSFRNATRALSRGCDLRSGALPRPRDGVLGAREERVKRDRKAGRRQSSRGCARPRPASAHPPRIPSGSPEPPTHSPVSTKHQGPRLQRLPGTQPRPLLLPPTKQPRSWEHRRSLPCPLPLGGLGR